MNYHNIIHDDMNNGNGIRVTVFLSGCSHHCKDCQNPQTWNKYSGIEFDDKAKEEIFNELSKDYIKGITFSGGDPLYDSNSYEVFLLCQEIKEKFPTKDIWLYTGYTFEEIKKVREKFKVITMIDVLVDGKFDYKLKNVNLHWVGSSNQRVINVQETLKQNKIILFNN